MKIFYLLSEFTKIIEIRMYVYMHYDLRKRLRLRENREKGKRRLLTKQQSCKENEQHFTLTYDVYTGHETVNIFRQMSVQVEKTV